MLFFGSTAGASACGSCALLNIPFGCGSKPCTPGEHQNRWYMGVHPPQNEGIRYDPWPFDQSTRPFGLEMSFLPREPEIKLQHCLELGPFGLPARWCSACSCRPSSPSTGTGLSEGKARLAPEESAWDLRWGALLSPDMYFVFRRGIKMRCQPESPSDAAQRLGSSHVAGLRQHLWDLREVSQRCWTEIHPSTSRFGCVFRDCATLGANGPPGLIAPLVEQAQITLGSNTLPRTYQVDDMLQGEPRVARELLRRYVLNRH